MGELKEFPNRLPTDAWVSKKQLAGILDRSIRWVEMRVKEGMPSRMRGNKRIFNVGAVQDWLKNREEAQQQNDGDPAPATPEEQRFAELETRVTALERELAELKGKGEPDEPGDAA